MGFLLLYVLLVPFFIVVLLYFHFRHKYNYFKRLNIPYIKPIFPFGNVGPTIVGQENACEYLAKLYENNKHHPVVGYFSFQSPIYLINDPDYIKDILVRRFSSFHNRGFDVNFDIDPLLGNLFLFEDEKWQWLRNKLSPLFTTGKIRTMFTTVDVQSEKLLEYLNNHHSDQVNIKELFGRLLTDIIASCAFGIDSNSIENPKAEFREWGRLSSITTKRNIIVSLLMKTCKPLRDFLKIPFFDPNLTKFFSEMVSMTIKYRERENIIRQDFMQTLIELKNKPGFDGTTLTSMECAAQAFIFFQAASETSSITMSYTIYEIAKNPYIQERLQKEIDEIIEQNGFTYEALRLMTYFDKIIFEVLRKYTPLPVLERVATETIKVPWGKDRSMITLKKGSKIIIPILGLHHDSNYYADPESFNPDRFNDEEKLKRHQYTYLPFGEGPHFCIGQRFGLMQIKLGLAKLLHHYTFKPSELTPFPIEFEKKSPMLVPKGDQLFLRLEKRR